ncbi:hypothetical protein D3C75_1181180 [compost metagenome]
MVAKQRARRVQKGQVAVHADSIATLGKPIIILAGVNEILLCLQLVDVSFTCSQPIGDLLESGLDSFLVVGHTNVFLDLRVIQAGA